MPSQAASFEGQSPQVGCALIRNRAQSCAAILDMGAGLREILG